MTKKKKAFVKGILSARSWLWLLAADRALSVIYVNVVWDQRVEGGAAPVPLQAVGWVVNQVLPGCNSRKIEWCLSASQPGKT